MKVGFYDTTTTGFVLLEADKVEINKNRGYIKVYGNREIWIREDDPKHLGKYSMNDLRGDLLMLPDLTCIKKAGD